MRPDPCRGSCLCGAVTYVLELPTDFVAHCHCASCRAISGAAFLTWTSVPRDRLTIHGEDTVRWYQSSDTIRWGSCAGCGSTLFYCADAEGHPEAPRTDCMYLTVGTLHDPLDRDPGAHVSFEERVPWFTPADHLPTLRGKTSAPCPTSSVQIILFVSDPERSRTFYAAVLGRPPSLHVPGMTEFRLPGNAVLGLMTERGIRTLLGPELALGPPGSARSEIYLRTPDAPTLHQRALDAGAHELSARCERSWGECVSYVRDPDGHILALAG